VHQTASGANDLELFIILARVASLEFNKETVKYCLEYHVR